MDTTSTVTDASSNAQARPVCATSRLQSLAAPGYAKMAATCTALPCGKENVQTHVMPTLPRHLLPVEAATEAPSQNTFQISATAEAKDAKQSAPEDQAARSNSLIADSIIKMTTRGIAKVPPLREKMHVRLSSHADSRPKGDSDAPSDTSKPGTAPEVAAITEIVATTFPAQITHKE